MARKGQAVFQLEINSDEEWKLLLAKPGLIVNDVFSEWCGPCTSMMSTIKKTKVEVNSDFLIFTMANADKIEDLERFRGSSEPIWIFIASYQLLRVVYGCNSPMLIGVIMKEFENEMACIEGTAKRISRSLKELTPEEEQKQSEKMKKKLKEEEEKKKDIEQQWDKIRHRYYERVARYITNLSVVVFFPHTVEVIEGGKEICPPSNRLMGQYDVAHMNIKDQLEVQLTKETIPKLFYNSGVLFPRILLRSLEKRPVIATLLAEFETRELELKTSSMIRLEAIEHLDEAETRVANLAYGESMNPLDPTAGSPCAEFMFYTPNGTAVPPFWTPREHVSKSAAIEVLFPAIVEALEVKMDPLPPSSYVVIFEARRAREVLDTALQFASNVMHVGFFDSENPDEAEMICQTVHEYERLPKAQRLGLKMVLALERTSSDPMLILASMGPLYISPDVRQGLKEVETFFPPMVDKVAEPDPWGPPPEDGGVEEELEEEMEEEGSEEFSEEMDLDEDELRQSSMRPDDTEMVADEGPRPSAASVTKEEAEGEKQPEEKGKEEEKKEENKEENKEDKKEDKEKEDKEKDDTEKEDKIE
ncbi:unnamed protein product [Nezara viridula]|uniref:DUF4746 domain-containing protein n=1 Tax=Nezara viridula TaxID=85310 RepID=A0A9P0HA11_NEZVI|nr:unnamed protein product [Nezara viridula]